MTESLTPGAPNTDGQLLVAPEGRRDTLDPESAGIVDQAFYRSARRSAARIIVLNPLMEDQALEQAEGWVEKRVAVTNTSGSQP